MADVVEQGFAVGSGVVEAASKTLAIQRKKRSGMRLRIAGGQAVPTFRAPIVVRRRLRIPPNRA